MKFKIGDLVITKISKLLYGGDNEKLIVYQVRETLIQECYGGKQIFYDCRGHCKNLGTVVVESKWTRFTEDELEIYENNREG